MSRARRAQRIAATAAYGGGGVAAAAAGLGALGSGLVKAEAAMARRIVGEPFDGSPDDDGVYGAGPGQPVEMLVLGDSSAAGMGAVCTRRGVNAVAEGAGVWGGASNVGASDLGADRRPRCGRRSRARGRAASAAW